MSSIIDRIKEIIVYKGISERKFSLSIGVSNGFLSKVSDVGSSKLTKILNVYPEINPTWLLTGEGEMFEKSKNNKETIDRKLKHASTPLAEIEKIGVEQYLENEIEKDKLSIQYDFPLLEKFIKANNVKSIVDNFSDIQGDVSMISTYLTHYDLHIGMLDSLKKYRNKEINLESLTAEFKQEMGKELELYKLIEPYKEAIHELYIIVSNFNSKHDRLYWVDENISTSTK